MKVILYFALLSFAAIAQNISLGQKIRVQLIQDTDFKHNYTLSFNQSDLKKFNQNLFDKWFLFLDLQPINNVTWLQTYVDLYILKQNGQPHHKKSCLRYGVQLQSCFIVSSDFDFRKDKIIVQVASDEPCNITLKSEVSSLFKLDLNICLELDYQKQAFSKLFQINLANLVDFKQIRIYLTPMNQLYSGQPIHLYLSSQNYIPSPTAFDFIAFDIWDYGKAIIIDSSQIKEATKLIILVDAPQHFIYNLQTQIILKYEPVTIKTGQKYHDVMELNAMRQYNFKFVNPSSKQNYIRVKNYHGLAYVLSFRSGKVIKNSTELDDLAQLVSDQLLSQINYQVAEGVKQITATINTMSFISTFTVQTYEAKSGINQLLEGAIRINKVSDNQKTFFFARIVRFKQDNLGDSKARFQIRTQTGKTDQKFYYCKKDELQSCKKWIQTYEIDGKQNKKIIEFPHPQNIQVQRSNTFIFQIQQALFTDYNQKYKQAIIFVQIVGKDPLVNSTLSIIFRNIGIMYNLAEQEIKTQKLQSQEIHFYRFSVRNAQGIDAIYFYYSVYYGQIQIFLSEQNPVGKTQVQLTLLFRAQQAQRFHRSENHLLVSKVQSNKTYYIIALSLTQSYFTINTQVVRNQKHNQDINMKNLSFSTIQITEQSDFKYMFQPSTIIFFQFRPQGERYLVHFQSSLPLDVCIQNIQNKAQHPIEPNCDRVVTIGKAANIFLSTYGSKKVIGIKNFHNKTTELKIKMYSDWDKCDFKQLGQKILLQTSILKQRNMTSACAIFKIYKKQQLLIIAKQENPLTKNNFYLQLKIGQKQKIYLTSEQNIISAQEIDQSCQGEYEWCYMHLTFTPFEEADLKQFYNEQITVWTQFTDQPIMLEDGISFTSAGIVTKTSPRYFKYLLYELEDNVTFILQNKQGFYKAFLKLQYYQDRFAYPTPNDVSEQNFTYQTNNQMLSIYQTITIKSEDMKKKCTTKGAKYCVILISVYPLNHDEIVNGKFRVQITQFVSQLIQNSPSVGYLQKGSLGFYEFDNKKQGGTISIFANTNNQHCLSMFARQGIRSKATNSNNDKNIKNGPQLIINDAKVGKYSITLQASKNCQYHLQVSTFTSQFTVIKKGYSIDLDMKAGQQRYLLFENQLKSSFRIMALFSVSSQILIKAFASRNDDQLEMFMNSNDTSSFSSHQYDWEDRNSLRIDESHSKFCSNCYYVVRIQALKDINGSLTIPSTDQEITIKSDSFIYDQLYKGQKSIYRAYTTSHIKFQLQLQSGKIHMRVINKQTNTTLKQKSYESSDKLIQEKIVLQNNLSYEYFRYTYIELTCVQNSHFVFSVVKGTKQQGQQIDGPTQADRQKVLNFMHFGIPKQIILKKNNRTCINGVMEQDPTFLISSKDILQDNKITKVFTSNDKVVPLSVKQIKNGMILKLQTSKTQFQLTYELCLSSQKQLKLTIIQSAYINYIPENIQLAVTNNTNLTFMANGSTILQVGECGSQRAILSISKDFKSVHEMNSEIKQFRKSNNLIEFNFTGPVYIQSQIAYDGVNILSWKQKNEQKGTGMGYDIYYPSNFLMIRDQQNNAVYLSVKPLNKYETSQKLPFRIKKLSYELFVGNSEAELSSNVNCHYQKPIDRIQTSQKGMQDGGQFQLSAKQIKNLQQQYGTAYTLISVLVKITVQTTYGQEQSYRFLYPYHQLVFDIRQIPIGEKPVRMYDQMGKYMILFLLVCLIAVGIFFGYRFYLTKKRRERLMNRQAINTIVQAEMIDGYTINDQ